MPRAFHLAFMRLTEFAVSWEAIRETERDVSRTILWSHRDACVYDESEETNVGS
jgi:hypothetical protein